MIAGGIDVLRARDYFFLLVFGGYFFSFCYLYGHPKKPPQKNTSMDIEKNIFRGGGGFFDFKKILL